MSSDSDDYSYTNSVSVLKALTKKKDTSLDPDVTTPKRKHVVNFFDTSISPGFDLHQDQDNTNNTIDLDLSIKSNANDSCVIVSDGEADLTPGNIENSPSINIISAIDNVLQKKKQVVRRNLRPRREKRKALGTPTPPQTRKSKRVAIMATKIIQNVPTQSDVSVDDVDTNDVNFEVIVKVYWKSQYLEKFKMKRFEKLTKIYKHFSEKENVPENRLLFTIKNELISKNDTPESLNITAATIIEGGVITAKNDMPDDKKQNGIKFKIQMKDRKQPLLITMNPEDKMDVLMAKCAVELQISVNKLKFYFDGELIKSNDTPECLDLEGGEIIDCVKT